MKISPTTGKNQQVVQIINHKNVIEFIYRNVTQRLSVI